MVPSIPCQLLTLQPLKLWCEPAQRATASPCTRTQQRTGCVDTPLRAPGQPDCQRPNAPSLASFKLNCSSSYWSGLGVDLFRVEDATLLDVAEDEGSLCPQEGNTHFTGRGTESGNNIDRRLLWERVGGVFEIG